jgi:hypothetical protein
VTMSRSWTLAIAASFTCPRVHLYRPAATGATAVPRGGSGSSALTGDGMHRAGQPEPECAACGYR